MENEGLKRSMNYITNKGLDVQTLITDRHKQNNVWIKRNLPNTTHYFDIWHVSKGNESQGEETFIFIMN